MESACVCVWRGGEGRAGRGATSVSCKMQIYSPLFALDQRSLYDCFVLLYSMLHRKTNSISYNLPEKKTTEDIFQKGSGDRDCLKFGSLFADHRKFRVVTYLPIYLFLLCLSHV